MTDFARTLNVARAARELGYSRNLAARAALLDITDAEEIAEAIFDGIKFQDLASLYPTLKIVEVRGREMLVPEGAEWWVRDEVEGWEADLDFDDPETSLESLFRQADYAPDDSTYWVEWTAKIDLVEADGTTFTYSVSKSWTVDPEEPDCLDQEHDWCSPYEVLGGLEENPGVEGNGGGVIIREVCRHCGHYRITNTWAQNPATGEQGLISVHYESEDDASTEWVSRLRFLEPEVRAFQNPFKTEEGRDAHKWDCSDLNLWGILVMGEDGEMEVRVEYNEDSMTVEDVEEKILDDLPLGWNLPPEEIYDALVERIRALGEKLFAFQDA